ncbi:MAG: hypothetical protein N2C12_16915, partial [Planctomycetales bacterium]
RLLRSTGQSLLASAYNRCRPKAVLREGTLTSVIEYCPAEDQKPTESEQLLKRRSIKGRQTRAELVSSSDD